jgi:5-(carboxyamino)imidazole ribonucleotide synthase
MGHINLSASSTSELAQRFDLLRQHLPEQEFPELDLVAARLKQLQ